MKERPILFSGAMVQAILSGAKTQTRRVIKPAIPDTHLGWNNHGDDDLFFWTDYPGQGEKGKVLCRRCPYGARKTRLWVREAWRTHPQFDKQSAAQIESACLDAGYSSPWAPIRYEADGKYYNWEVHDRVTDGDGRLRPSIHMPRWASRITLEVTGIRVERLQDISEEDAKAEGVQRAKDDIPFYGPYKDAFAKLWDSINAKRVASFESNPFVWVVEFRRID